MNLGLVNSLNNYAGKNIPNHYGDLLKEYEATQTGIGLFNLSTHGIFEIGGNERIQFLNGLLSNYVKQLPTGFGVSSLFLTAQGKVLADCRIYCLENSFWIEVDPAAREKILKLLSRLTYAGDFKVTDQNQNYGMFFLCGPNSIQLLEQVTSQDFKDWNEKIIVTRIDNKSEEISAFSIDNRKLGEIPIILARSNRIGIAGYDLFIPIDQLHIAWEKLIEKGNNLGLSPVGWNILETLRIEAGLGRYSLDFDEEIIALEAGLDYAISYNKGCYTGQETIAKIHWRGHDQVARRLSRFIISGDKIPENKTQILDEEKKVGYITSSIYSIKRKEIIALGYIRTSAAKSKQDFSLKLSDETLIKIKLVDEF